MSKQKKKDGPAPLVANSKITILGVTYDFCERDVVFSELMKGPNQDWVPITGKVYTGLVQFVARLEAKLYRLLQPIEQLVYDIATARPEKIRIQILMPTLYSDETLRFIENYLMVCPFGPFSSAPNAAAKALIASPTLGNKLAYVYSDSPRPKLTAMVVQRAIGINAVNRRTIEEYFGKRDNNETSQDSEQPTRKDSSEKAGINHNEKFSSTFPADRDSDSKAEIVQGATKDDVTSQQLAPAYVKPSVDGPTLDSAQEQELDPASSLSQAAQPKTAHVPDEAGSASLYGHSSEADTEATHESSSPAQAMPVNQLNSDSKALAIWDKWAIANNAETHDAFISHYPDPSKARNRLVQVISNKEMPLETIWELHCTRHPSARRPS